MRKVLIITYYWPPSGGGGVMRWLKMSKYLPEYGWQPIIYTPLNPDPSMIDESLLNEIHPYTITIKKDIWEPYNIYRKLTKKARSQKIRPSFISEASSGNWKEQFSVFIRGNFLIPDPRVFWVKPSIRFLAKYLKEHPVDLIISTGPPHSMHLIGLGLKIKLNIPWMADFRDPWTKIDFYHNLKLTFFADALHKYLEKKVLRTADMVITVSPGCAKDLLIPNNKQIEIIFNGFDPADFKFLGEHDALDKKFTISHFGSLGKDRNPIMLWKALGRLSSKNQAFRERLEIVLIGSVDQSVLKSVEANGIKPYLTLLNDIPHQQGLKKLSTSQVLLLALNNAPNALGILPGKLFEYLALKRPILAVGPDSGDYKIVLQESGGGYCHDFEDYKGICESLTYLFSNYLENNQVKMSTEIDKYSRKNLASDLVKKLNQLVN